MEENFLLDLVSCIEQNKSQKQINSDVKTLEKTINMLRLTATLAKGSSKKEINAYIKTLSNQLSTIKLKAQIDSKNLKGEVNKALNNVSFKDIDALNIDENKTKLKVQKVIADTKSFVEKNPISVGVNIESKKNKLGNDLTAYLNRNSKINESSVLLNEANKVRDLINTVNDKKSLRDATDAFQLYKSEVSATGFASKSTTDRIKAMFGHITKLGSLFSVTSLAVNNFTKSLGTLKELDNILTEISKTSDLTAQQLERLGNTSFKAASKYGKTASDYLTGIQEMSRSGFYGEKGSAMAEQSLLAQSAGDISADLANNYILATNAAYKLNGEAEKINAVLNGQNSITNRNSVAMADMATAMSKAGTVASSYRVSVEDLSAMIGTIESVTKAEGGEVGNAIKAILINLQNVTSDKITDTLDAANASMTEFVNGAEKLRNPIDILRDLAETFNKLDEDDALRAEILTNIGGKHQSAKLAALLQNMEMFDKMLVDYSEGSGSAMEEAMKSANNWSGKLNQLQNSWDSLVNSIVSKDTVLNGLTFGDKLIQGIESLINTLGEIPVIITTVSTAMTALNKDFGITQIINPETKKLDLEGNLGIIDFSAIKKQKVHFEEAEDAIGKWNGRLKVGKANIEKFEESVVKSNASLKAYLQTTSKDAPASLVGYKNYLQSTGQATEDLRLKTILLNTALTLLGSIAVQAVITGIANAFDKFNETVEESQEIVGGINSKISDLKSQIEELNNLEYKSDFDEQKISQLEKELELQEKILEVEQKRLYQNQIGTKFSDYFDEDSLVVKEQEQYDRYNKEGFKYLSVRFETDKSSLEEVETELSSLQERLNNGVSGHERFQVEGQIEKLTEKRNKLLEEQQSIEEQLIINSGEYLKNYQTAQEAVDSGLLTGSDLEKAESMAQYWNQLYQDSVGIVENIQKMGGRYDNTNDLLEEKFKGISRDELASLSDDDKRIALSFDPNNTIGFEELQKQIAETKGDIEELNATEVKSFDQAWADSFTSEDDKVRELGNSLLELAEKGRLTKETFNEADSNAGDYFQNLGISADEAVSKINKLVDESSQLSSMSDQISSMAEALGTKQENGFVEADTLAGFDVEVRGLESWDHFQEVLGSTTSSYEECQEAANALATEWVNSSDFLAQLTEQNEEYYKTQLEAMGVENYEEVISYAHALNEAKEVLSQSSLELGNATYDEIEALIAEGTYSELTANMILALYDAKIAEQAATLDTSADCANLIALAGDTDRTSQSIQLLISLMNIYSELESGAYNNNAAARTGALGVVNGIKSQLEALANGKNEKLEVNPTVKLGSKGKSSAGKAGKDAGKTLKDALKEELSDLNSVISGITGRIDDQISVIKSQKEAALESIDAQIDALNEQKSALEAEKKALEEARDAAIDALEEERDTAVDALEEERDARIEVIEQQKEQLELNIKLIEKQIKEKEKVIDGINDEIKAMTDANEQRKRAIDLQKAQYELERLQHQRTILQYSEGMGLHYVTDSKNIREQKEKVDDAKLEIEIANKQKQIDLIEKEINLLNEKKDALNEQIALLDEESEKVKKFYDDEIEKVEEFYDAEIKKVEEFYDAQIKAIDAQIESIDKQIEALEKQREHTEKYYESLIENIEKSKSKYEELAEIVEKAELSAALKKLGIDEEALLNGSEEEFEKLKNAYLNVVAQLNSGNDEVLSALQELSGYDGAAPAMLEESNGKLDEMNGKLDTSSQSVGSVNDSLADTASKTSEAAANVNELTASLSGISTIVTNEQSAFDTLKQKIDEVITAVNEKIAAIQAEQEAVNIATSREMADFLLLRDKILEVQESINSIGNNLAAIDVTPVNNLTTAFQALYEQNSLVATTLGAGTGTGMESQEQVQSGTSGEGAGAVNSITSAIQALNDISLEDGIIAQFISLKTAVDDVTAAINGGGSGGEDSGSGGSGSKGNGSGGNSSESEGEGGSSLTGAFTEMGEAANEIIGEPGAEGDGTVIGEFGSMKTAVNDVTTAIGSGGSESSGQGSEGDGGNLISSINDLGDTTQGTLGEPDGDGVTGRFGELSEVIGEAEDHVKGISEGLDEIDGKEVECTITVNIVTNGTPPAFATGTALDSMDLNSAEYNAKYTGNAHVSGTANVTGNWGIRKPGKSLVGELGQEIWVHSKDGTFETVGDNGPEWIKTEKDDIIFNHLQTKELLDKGNIVKTGKAYANGTVQYSDGTIIQPNGDVLRPLQPGDRAYDLMKAFEPLVQRIQKGEDEIISNAVFEGQRQLEKWTKEITNNTAINNIVNNRNMQQPIYQTFNITMPNVTNATSADALLKDLQSLAMKRSQVKW